MGTSWKGFVLGETAPAAPQTGGVLVAVALPAEFFYFKWIPLSAGARRGIRDLRGYAAGAIDPDLPVAVEDCLVYCRPDASGAAAFAIEKSRLNAAIGDAEKSFGRTCDCIVPFPLAIWDFAAASAAARTDGFRGTLLHLHAGGSRWTLCAGSAVRRGIPPLKAVATVAAGDMAGVRRAAAILASRLSADQGSGLHETAASISGGGASAELAAALAAACGLPESSEAQILQLDAAEAVARCAKRSYLANDLPIVEAESDAVKRARAGHSLFPAAVAAIGAAMLLISSAARDISSRRAIREADAEIGRAAERLSGMPMRRKSPAAIAPARNAFAERFPERFREFAVPAPRDIVRTVFAFAVARGITLAGIESDGSRIAFSLSAESGGDIEALAEELRRSGYATFAEAADQSGHGGGAEAEWLLTTEMEASR